VGQFDHFAQLWGSGLKWGYRLKAGVQEVTSLKEKEKEKGLVQWLAKEFFLKET